MFRAAGCRDWREAIDLVQAMTRTWGAHQRHVRVPAQLAAQINNAFQQLDEAVAARNVAATRQAAVDVGKAGVDIEAQYQSVRTTDSSGTDCGVAVPARQTGC
jgi:hypothetical protein